MWQYSCKSGLYAQKPRNALSTNKLVFRKKVQWDYALLMQTWDHADASFSKDNCIWIIKEEWSLVLFYFHWS